MVIQSTISLAHYQKKITEKERLKKYTELLNIGNAFTFFHPSNQFVTFQDGSEMDEYLSSSETVPIHNLSWGIQTFLNLQSKRRLKIR